MLAMPLKISCSALLFDMDGVLVDSTPAVARVWTRWAQAHGFDPNEVIHAAHGRPSIATIRDYLPHADHHAEDRLVERLEMEDLQGVVACPGAHELLASLPPDGWAVVTSSTRPLAELRMQTAGLSTPRLFITSTEVTHGKPHPEPYLAAAARLGFSAADCVVCEDVPAGIRAGKASGARVIAFRTTTRDEALWDAGADWVVDSCADLALMASSPELTLSLRTAKAAGLPTV